MDDFHKPGDRGLFIIINTKMGACHLLMSRIPPGGTVHSDYIMIKTREHGS